MINSENIFKDIAICSDCEGKLVRRRRVKNNALEYYFLCSTFESNGGYKCSRKHILESELIDVVYETIRKQIELVASVDAVIEKVQSDKRYKTERDSIDNEIRELNTKIKRSNSLRTSIYDDYMEKILSEKDYLFAKNKYEKVESLDKSKLEELLLQKKKYHETYAYENKCLSAFRAFKDEKVLTKQMVNELVNAIEIYSVRKVEVILKFRDENESLLSYMDVMGIEVKLNEK